jgi:hypothetical protein
LKLKLSYGFIRPPMPSMIYVATFGPIRVPSGSSARTLLANEPALEHAHFRKVLIPGLSLLPEYIIVLGLRI